MNSDVDSFFELRIQVKLSPYVDYFRAPLCCGPYFSHEEAVRVMTDGLPITLAAFWEDLRAHSDVTVHSQIVECVLLDNMVEILDVKTEETTRLGGQETT